jgi:predicted GIY-YIG superfamily endonuclease
MLTKSRSPAISVLVNDMSSKMYYVYVLKNLQTGRLYIGQSVDLRRRLAQHRSRFSWELVYYEAYRSRDEMFKRERVLKNYGTTWTRLKKRLSTSIEMAG